MAVFFFQRISGLHSSDLWVTTRWKWYRIQPNSVAFMSRPFSSFPKTRQPVSSGTLSALIQLQRQDLLTGMVDVAYDDGSQTLLFFNVGTPFVMFYRGEGAWRKVPSSQRPDIFAQPNGKAAIVPLGGDALRMCILALEAGTADSEEILLRPGGFKKHVDEIQARDAASLLWVREEAMQGFILVPGRKVTVQDALVFSPSSILTDGEAIARLTGLEDRLLRISLFEFPDIPSFLREYALRVVFLILAEPALKRFEQLAGDTLVESMGQEVNRYAFHQGWKIQFFGEHVQHRQYFQDVTEATTVYRSLFRMMKQYAHRVVGASLATGLVGEGIGLLPPVYRDIFERQNFLVG